MNSPVSQRLFSRRTARKSFVATAFLAALLSLGVAAFAQTHQVLPHRHQHRINHPDNLARESIWAAVR